MSITADQCVRVLKDARSSQSAAYVAHFLKTTPRAVATALRGPVADGRVTIRWHKGCGGAASYRFVRLKPKGGAA